MLYFQIGPLDQGYWPDGLLTPPSDKALKWDIKKTKLMGFNMIRKHIKIESKRSEFLNFFRTLQMFGFRWYYWTDKLGILVWQDFPCISDTFNMEENTLKEAQDNFKAEARRWMSQLSHHPSIILWVVFNEGWGQHDTVATTHMVMDTDPSRLVTCASGWTDHEVGHVVDVHVYPGPVINIFPEETQVHAIDPRRAAVVGEMWGVSMVVKGHLWYGDGNIVPDPRGTIDSEEEFLDKYQIAIEYVKRFL